jgi:hypothetical protein
MQRIAELTENETWIVKTALKERYHQDIEIEQAETELRLHSSDRELTLCPAIYWEHGDCHFIICKTGDRKYRCQFFYRLHQQFNTGIEEFDDITECIVTLLQTQADHESGVQVQEAVNS